MSPALAGRFFTTEPSGMLNEMLPSSFPFLTWENSLLLSSPGKCLKHFPTQSHFAFITTLPHQSPVWNKNSGNSECITQPRC